MTQCFSDIAHPKKPRCPNEGKWHSEKLGLLDNWVWCDIHKFPGDVCLDTERISPHLDSPEET
jgi:hypothetical protein